MVNQWLEFGQSVAVGVVPRVVLAHSATQRCSTLNALCKHTAATNSSDAP